MEMFKEKHFKELASVHQPHCVSIYLPTHVKGSSKEVEMDSTRYKNALQHVAKQLKELELKDHEIDEYLKTAYALLEDREFWSYMSKGLAVFLYGNQMQYFRVPIDLPETSYIGDHLYLKPLIRMLNGDGRYFLLNLSLEHVKVYEATHHSIQEMILSTSVPRSFKDAVGHETEKRTVQMRTNQGEGGSGMFHGHGMGEATEKKEEMVKFFRQINNGLIEEIHDETVPLVVACVEYLFPRFKEACTYHYLHDDFVEGNHEHTPLDELHKKSWNVIKSKFEEKREHQMNRYRELVGTGRASYNLDELIPAAVSGRIDTLFLKSDEHLWGVYDKETHSIHKDGQHRVGNADLFNTAAVHTLMNSGQVFLIDNEEEMPEPETLANAVYRH